MNLRKTAGSALALCLLFAAWSVMSAEPDLKGIMQGLRDDVSAITDGLLTDDFDKVAVGAGNIASHPKIPAAQVQLVAAELGAEMATFKGFDTAVHDLSLSIAAAAAESDGALAFRQFQQMLSNCMACHTAYKDRVASVLGGASPQ